MGNEIDDEFERGRRVQARLELKNQIDALKAIVLRGGTLTPEQKKQLAEYERQRDELSK